MVEEHLAPDGARPVPARCQEVDGDALGLHGEEVAFLALEVLHADGVGNGHVLQDDLGRGPQPSPRPRCRGCRRGAMPGHGRGCTLLCPFAGGRSNMGRCSAPEHVCGQTEGGPCPPVLP